MRERLVGAAVDGSTVGQIIHNLPAEERLQAVEAFLVQPLPEECKEFGEAFNQDSCDAWVAEAFPVKDHISYLINSQCVSSEEALSLVGRWEGLLGYDTSVKQGRVLWSIYNGTQQGIRDPQKPGYRYRHVDYHNRAVEPQGPHEGYIREGLGFVDVGLDAEKYKELLSQLKAGHLVGRDYDGSLTNVFGVLQSDASLAVTEWGLAVQMTVVDMSKKQHYESPEERTWYETPYHIVSEQSGNRFKNVFDMLLRRRRPTYEDRTKEINGEYIARVLLEHKETWQALGDPELERKAIEYIEKVVAAREDAEQGRLAEENTRRAAWLKRQNHLIGELALLTASAGVPVE